MVHAITNLLWYQLLKAVLGPAVFLSWRSAYDNQAEFLARTNLLLNVPVTYDMLTVHGEYVHPVHQAQTGLNAYFSASFRLSLQGPQGLYSWDLSA